MSAMLTGERTPRLRRAAVLVLLLVAVTLGTSCRRKTPTNLGQTGSTPYGTAVTWGPLKLSRGYVGDLRIEGAIGVGSVVYDSGASTEGTYLYALDTSSGNLIGDANVSGSIYATDIGERYVFVWVKDGISVYDLKKQFAFVQTIPTGAPRWVMNLGDFLYVEVRNAPDYLIDKRTLKKKDLNVPDDDYMYQLLYPDCLIGAPWFDSGKQGDPAVYDLDEGKVLGHVPSEYISRMFGWDPQKNLFFCTDRDRLVVYDFSKSQIVSEIMLTSSETYAVVADSHSSPAHYLGNGDRLHVTGNATSLTNDSYFFNGKKYAYVVDTSGRVIAEQAGSEILGRFGGYTFSRKSDSIFPSQSGGDVLWTKKGPEEPFHGSGPYFADSSIVWLCDSSRRQGHGDGIYQWDYKTGSFLNYTEFTGYEAQVLSSQPLIVAMRNEKGGVSASWCLVCYKLSKLPFNWMPDFSIDCSPDKVYSSTTDAKFTCAVKNVPAEFGSNDISYTWDFGDGTTGTGNGITHRFAKDGSYNVTISVKFGNSVDALSKSLQIAVLKSPDIRLVATPEYYVADGLTYRLEYKSDNLSAFGNVAWDFGDGNQGSTTNVLHTYKLGNYTAKATVTNTDKTQSWHAEVAISARYPEFTASASTSAGDTALEVNFSCSLVSTGLTDAGLSYTWKTGSNVAGTKSTLDKVFVDAGTYSTILEVRDPAARLVTSKTFQTTVYGPHLVLSDGGRKLESTCPIFIKPEYDVDKDGINQAWEDEAMRTINPYFELDEEEDWFRYQDTDKVVNYVRVAQYANKSNEKYILFFYAICWSRDYGRYSVNANPIVEVEGLESHDGDVEKVVMAWKVIDDKNLELQYVYTSAHGTEATSHSSVWGASGQSCNTGKTLLWPSKKTVDDRMCATLEFNNDILKLQVSEDKHAIYPTAACGDGVSLVLGVFGEDCGGGGLYRFNCYNAGESNAHLIDDIGDIFPGDRVWSGNVRKPSRFCGGRDGGDKGPGRIGSALTTLDGILKTKLDAIPAVHNP